MIGSLALLGTGLAPMRASAADSSSAPNKDGGCARNRDSGSNEPIIEPNLPIIDPHQHLWFLGEPFFNWVSQQKDTKLDRYSEIMRGYARYLMDEAQADVSSGHDVRATVYMEAMPMRPMYRRMGLPEMQSLGEVEFANGIAAMADSGGFGAARLCAGIVGYVNLQLSEPQVERILSAHMQASSRYRGVRNSTDDLGNERFRSGFKYLHKLGLSFDAHVFSAAGLSALISLARDYPETQIILDHLGYTKDDHVLSDWRENLRALSACENVVVKLGGLGMSEKQRPFRASPRWGSDQLAAEWKPLIHTCIELFGAHRCMFEGNFPMDSASCSYAVLWNTFKRLATGASAEEKKALFSGTASKAYRVTV